MYHPFSNLTYRHVVETEVVIVFPNSPQGPQTQTVITNQSGSYHFDFAGGDPNGTYIVTLSDPDGRTFPPEHQVPGPTDQSNLNFDFIPNVSYTLTDPNGSSFYGNNPAYPKELCSLDDLCLGIVDYQNQIGGVYQSTYCFQMDAYYTNGTGQKLGKAISSNRSHSTRVPDSSCPNGINLNTALFDNLTSFPYNQLLRVDIRVKCCSSGAVGDVFTFYLKVNDVQVEATVTTGVSDSAEPLGNSCSNPVSSCRDALILEATMSIGEADEFWLVIDEYDLNCNFIQQVANGSSNPTPISSINSLDNIDLHQYVRCFYSGSNMLPPYDYFQTGFPNIDPPGLPNNSPFCGDGTNQEFSASPTVDRKYKLELFTRNSCGTFSTSGWFTNQIVCFDDDEDPIYLADNPDTDIVLNNKHAVKIFPNPMTNEFSVSLNDFTKEGTITNLSLYSSTGQVVKIKQVSASKKSVSFHTSDLLEGLYFLQIKTDERVETYSIVK